MNKWIILCLMCVSAQAQAQHNKLLQEYRTKVKAYNQDIKAAGYAASIQQEKEKSAKADFLPSLSGNANFNYTGNPAEISVAIPSLNEPVSFQGRYLLLSLHLMSLLAFRDEMLNMVHRSH